MARPVTLFTGQWADLGFEQMCARAAAFGYDGVELACWGDHFEVDKALAEDDYCEKKWQVLTDSKLKCFAISNHLVGQAVCDLIDNRHKAILPERVWGDGDPEGVRKRAADEMKDTARACRKFFDAAPEQVKDELKRRVVCGFTGSSIWHKLYAFPPTGQDDYEAGYRDFAERWNPILDVFDEVDVLFALEAHPTEIAFDIATAERAVEALDGRKAFGFNFDPSHFGYQGVDYVRFIYEFGTRIYHVHMKDVGWADSAEAGVFGGNCDFGDVRRYWDFRSLGRGNINFEEIIRALNRVGYDGPLSVEWEDSGMDREAGAIEACAYVRTVDFPPAAGAFDAAFEK
jgi:sugar phosphate isomerase/epimerase